MQRIPSRASFWIALAAFLISPRLFAEGAPSGSSLLLTVQEGKSKEPVAAASVALRQYARGDLCCFLTDEAGRVRLPLKDEPLREVEIRVSKDGYVPRRVQWRADGPKPAAVPKEFSLLLEKTRPIGGIVVDEKGEPVPHAELWISIPAWDEQDPQLVQNDIVDARIEANERGEWTFPNAPPELKHLSIKLEHPDYAEEKSVRLPSLEDFPKLKARLVMSHGSTISGTVRDEAGNPLKSVDVSIHRKGVFMGILMGASTDEHGRYTIRRAPEQTPGHPGSGVVLSFLSDDYAPEKLTVAVGNEETVADVILHPGKEMTGRVIDEDGNAVPEVGAFPATWQGINPFGCWGLTTDTEGRFTWKNAPADEVIFSLSKEGFLQLDNVPLQAGRDNVLTLRRTPKITATVVDAETGRDISSFEVLKGVLWRNTITSFDALYNAKQGKDGAFTWNFDTIPQSTDESGRVTDIGKNLLRVESPGYIPEVSRPIAENEKNVRLEFRLRKGEKTTVRVQSRDGHPVEGAVIVASEGSSYISIREGRITGGGDRYRFVTNEAGEATLPPLDGDPQLVIAHPVEGSAFPYLKEAAKGPTTLAKWGRVVIHSGSIQKAKKPMFFANSDPPETNEPNLPPLYRIHTHGTVEADGVLVFAGMKPGPVRVGRFGQAVDYAEVVQVPEGGDVVVEMPTHDGLARIEGQLTLPRDLATRMVWRDQKAFLQKTRESRPWPPGLTIAERRDWLENTPEGRKIMQEPFSFSSRITADGTFAFEDMAPGRYTVNIQISEGTYGTPAYKNAGTFEEDIVIPSREELARKSATPLPPVGQTFLTIKSNPAFHRALNKGDALPDFSTETLSGHPLSTKALRGQEAVLFFFSSYPESTPDTTADLVKCAELAKSKGITILALSTDDEKQMLTRALAEFPLPENIQVVWIDPDKDRPWLKKLGPYPRAFSITANGKIAGRFNSATEAVQSLAP